jgi:hypothetical protein
MLGRTKKIICLPWCRRFRCSTDADLHRAQTTYRIFKRYFVTPLPVAALWKPATGAAGAAARAAGGGAARGGAEGTYRIFKRYFVTPLPVAALWKPATGAARIGFS